MAKGSGGTGRKRVGGRTDLDDVIIKSGGRYRSGRIRGGIFQEGMPRRGGGFSLTPEFLGGRSFSVRGKTAEKLDIGWVIRL